MPATSRSVAEPSRKEGARAFAADGTGCLPYRAVELRAKTEAQFAIQYQKMNAAGGNFVPDMWGTWAQHQLSVAGATQPHLTAASLIEQVVIRRLMLGNAFIYIERDEWRPRCGWRNVAAIRNHRHLRPDVPGRRWRALQGGSPARRRAPFPEHLPLLRRLGVSLPSSMQPTRYRSSRPREPALKPLQRDA